MNPGKGYRLYAWHRKYRQIYQYSSRGEGKTLEDSEYPKAVMLAADERFNAVGRHL